MRYVDRQLNRADKNHCYEASSTNIETSGIELTLLNETDKV